MARKPKDAEIDADAAPAEGAEPAPGGLKGLLRNKLVLGGVGVVMLALIGGAGWFFLLRAKPAADTAETAAAAAQKATGFIEMKDMLVNISGAKPGERQNFIKVKIALEIADQKKIPEIQPLLPRVEDLFQVYLRELRPADLEGSAGTYRLREELLRRVNLAVAPARIEAVLFKELLVQ